MKLDFAASNGAKKMSTTCCFRQNATEETRLLTTYSCYLNDHVIGISSLESIFPMISLCEVVVSVI